MNGAELVPYGEAKIMPLGMMHIQTPHFNVGCSSYTKAQNNVGMIHSHHSSKPITLDPQRYIPLQNRYQTLSRVL